MSDSQPNILFIITDQQRADHAGFMGNNVVKTPNLDRIAANGMVFDNAWVSNPVCMPNRSTIMTGRMPTAHGVIFNDRSLEWGANTFVRRFHHAGYSTALIGKSHLQHGMSKNAVVPFRGSAASESPYETGWDQIEDFERYLNKTPESPEDFYGFGHIELSIDHGARATGHHLRWALEQGAKQEDVFVEYSADAPGSHRSENWWQIYQPPYEERFHSTGFVTERTVNFIEEKTKEDKPWLAWCSFPDPHHPMTPPGEWFHRHRPEDMELPATRHDKLEGAPAHLQHFRTVHPKQQRDWVTPCGYGNDDLLREAIAATYGMIEMIDNGVGQLLDCLERLQIKDNTIVVFTSDHGDMMGDHSLFLKGFMHYRGTMQVPFVIDAPDKLSGRTDSLASSIDLGPTLMDLCQIDSYDGIQGLSLTSILDEPATTVRDHVLIEDDIATITAKLTPIPAKTRTLVTQDYRYTRNSKGEEQLFDLRSDPDEMEDLKKRDLAARGVMLERLADALIEADDAARGAPIRS
ncbi:MAG: sulfatase-like hydrolase/transferase [Pseudomonadota bacterium]